MLNLNMEYFQILDPAKIQVKLKDYYFWMFFKKREVKNMELRFKK